MRNGRQVRIPIEVIEQLVREGYRPSLKQSMNGGKPCLSKPLTSEKEECQCKKKMQSHKN